MTIVNALDTAQAYLKSLGCDLETLPEDVQPLVEKLIHDTLVAQGTAAEAESRAERQDHQTALGKVSIESSTVLYKTELIDVVELLPMVLITGTIDPNDVVALLPDIERAIFVD